ncbi:MAG: hypothetical protein PHN31_04525 [Candidatus Gracilibacteria bacterium]|nr:hypothetical protein [Candidatus Gracilibacteria bacterium]
MKQRTAIKNIFFILVFIGVLFCFYKINELNYNKQKEIQANYVRHPEDLPTSEVAKITSFGFKNLRADLYRLRTIQYIGGNVMKSEYKKYLYQITTLINDLNPYFEHPYIIGQLLLPDYNQRYENLTDEEQKKYVDEGILIGLKGVDNFCDKQKVEMIKKEDDLRKLWTDKKYENPCKSYKIPFYLAYLYFYYNNDPINASLYYKVASANTDTVEGAKILAAIMMGKGGDRGKSIYMFLTLARSVVDTKKEEDQVCLKVAESMGTISVIDSSVLKSLENVLVTAFGKFDEKKEKDFIDSNTCKNYVYKASREMNLLYLDEANKNYFKSTGKNSKNPKELFDNGYIDYIPKDFQQYKDYGIIYQYNEKTGFYDYEMGDY